MVTYDDKPWLKFYDKHVTAEVPVPEITYREFLIGGLQNDPQKVAFYFLDKAFPFRELDDLSSRFANYLIKSGCNKGDVISINLPNIPQYLIAIAGTVKAGCVVSGVSPLLTPKEIVHQLTDSKAVVFVTLDILFQERFMKVHDRIPDLKHVVVTNIADFLPPVKRFLGKLLKKVPTGNVVPIPDKEVTTFKDVLAGNPNTLPDVELTPDDTFLLQYTGGTTGPSKGTVLTHRNLMFNIAQMVQWMDKDINPDKDILESERGRNVVCSAFPFFHQAGLGVGLAHMGYGNTQILVPDPRNTTQICKDLKKYRPNHLINVPTLYQLLMENPLFATIDFSNVDFFLSGAAPFDVDSIKELEKIVGEGKVVEVYGMTETSPIITMNPIYGKKKIGSVGIPAQSTRVKIVDVETGQKEMPVGEPGELIVNGAQVMKGYFNKPEATANTVKLFQNEPWMYTGDVARMDEDGYVYIVDRTKDMLLVGGYNVYSKQVEETLYEIPEIELCAIIGLPNPERPGSELVKAVIQLIEPARDKNRKEMEGKIMAHCRENLAAYKVPRIVEFIDAIPLTAVGKVDKKVLRQ